jgi:hypothetical protein
MDSSCASRAFIQGAKGALLGLFTATVPSRRPPIVWPVVRPLYLAPFRHERTLLDRIARAMIIVALFCSPSFGGTQLAPRQAHNASSFVTSDVEETAVHKHHRKGRLMKMTFARSGGFAGRATNVQGAVEFDSKGGHVTAEDAGYYRELPVAEATRLETLVTELTAGDKPPGARPMPDAYQYEISIAPDVGKTRTLVLQHDGVGVDTSAGSELFGWVQSEAQRIWDYKIANRKN